MSDPIAPADPSESRIGAPDKSSQVVDAGTLQSDAIPATSPAASGATAANPDSSSVVWLRRTDQIFVWLLSATLLVLLGIHWIRLSHWGMSPVELSSQQPREYYYSLDINKASWVEWAQLDGIGEKLARRIIADREAHGPFCDPSDVTRVKGIGPQLMEKIRPFLRGGMESESIPPTP